jgi:hypothetical protein
MLTSVDRQAKQEAKQRLLMENKMQNNEVFIVTK